MGLALQLRVRLQRLVQCVHVGLVVLVMVQPHGLGIDHRLQRLVGVGQCRDFVRHWEASCGYGMDGWFFGCAHGVQLEEFDEQAAEFAGTLFRDEVAASGEHDRAQVEGCRP